MALAPYMQMAAGPEQVQLSLRFQINGTSDPDFVFPAGIVSDITRGSAGLFNIFLNTSERYPSLVSCVGSVQAAAVGAGGVGALVYPVSYTAATGVLQVRVVDQDGTPTAADPANDDWVHVQAVFCRRTNLASVGAI